MGQICHKSVTNEIFLKILFRLIPMNSLSILASSTVGDTRFELVTPCVSSKWHFHYLLDSQWSLGSVIKDMVRKVSEPLEICHKSVTDNRICDSAYMIFLPKEKVDKLCRMIYKQKFSPL